MKRSVALFLMLCLAAAMFTACAAKPNPASDFKYQSNDDGGMTITEYVGTDSTVVIPATIENQDVTKIGQSAFWGNKTITSVTLPKTVTQIEPQAFAYCHSLETVDLPKKGLVSIGHAAFAECTALASITLPSTLKTLGSAAFAQCTALKEIKLPKSLTSIGEGVFERAGLESVTFQKGIQIDMIPCSAFAATSLKKVVLPSSVKTVDLSAFAACTSLESVKLNDGLIAVKDAAFGDTGLTEIIIPASVTDITEWAFDHCSALKKVKFEGNAPDAYRRLGEHPELPQSPSGVAYTVYYHEGASGFSSPTWHDYPTEIW